MNATGEWGRKAILAGWVIAMAGIAGCVLAIVNAPRDAGLFAALAAGGIAGWLSAALLIAGLGLWLAGYVAFRRGAK